jgi:hypothetical protein
LPPSVPARHREIHLLSNKRSSSTCLLVISSVLTYYPPSLPGSQG